MPENTKTKTVNYRRCVADAPAKDGNPPVFNLQEMLEKAKGKNQRPWIRKIGLNGERSQYLTYLVAKHGCLAGTLVVCEDNRLIPLVEAEKDGSTWEGVAEPKDKTGKKGKWQQQALYFAVRENHVAVIQTKELSISHLLDFLVWFIQSKAELAQGWMFTLQNLPSAKAIQKLKDHQIKGISIGKNAFSVVKTPAPGAEDGGRRKRYVKTIHTDPLMMGLLRKLTQNDAILDRLEQSKDPGSIYVELQISYKSRTEKDAQEVMRALAATVGDQPGLEPEIKLEGKRKIKGDELTITGSVEVQCPNGNIAGDDAMTRVAEWLADAIREGKVLV